jgi:hypothetical protein
VVAFWDVLDLVLLLVSIALLVLAVVLGVALPISRLLKKISATTLWIVGAATGGLVSLGLAVIVFYCAHPSLKYSRSDSDALQAIGTISGDVVTAVMAGTTLYAVILLRRGVSEQIRQLRHSAIQNIGREMLEINRWVADNPGYIEDIKRQASEDSPRAAAVAEVYADFIEQFVTQEEFLPDGHVQPWERYFRDIIREWPQLKKYMEERRHWYPDSMKELLVSEETTPPSTDTGAGSPVAVARSAGADSHSESPDAEDQHPVGGETP